MTLIVVPMFESGLPMKNVAHSWSEEYDITNLKP